MSQEYDFSNFYTTPCQHNQSYSSNISSNYYNHSYNTFTLQSNYYAQEFIFNSNINTISKYDLSEQQSGLKLTKELEAFIEEQQEIINTRNEAFRVVENDNLVRDEILYKSMNLNQKIKIKANPGSGKSTMLKKIAEVNNGKNFLFIAYNSSTQTAKEKEFKNLGIKNVLCYTLHSIALKGFLHEFKLINKQLNFVNEIFFSYIIEDELLVRKTLTNFLNSSDKFIEIKHCLDEDFKIAITDSNRRSIDFKKQDVIRHCNKVWNELVDNLKLLRNNHKSKINITHSTYLKLFSFNIDLQEMFFKPYSLLIDEAHDFNEVSMSILLKNKNFNSGCIVYDPNQSIYGFTNSVDCNRISDLDAHSFTLSLTFRFGAPLDKLVTRFIQKSKNEPNFVVTSHPDKNTYYKSVTGISEVLKEVNSNLLILARSNSGVLLEIVNLSIYNPNFRFKVLGKKEEFLEQITDLEELLKLNKGHGKFSRYFKGLAEMEKKYIETENITMIKKIEFVRLFPEKIKYLREICNLNFSEDLSNELVTFSTCHKAKGAEQDYVYLTDDYFIQEKEKDLNIRNYIEEINIIFVAMTRPIKKLYIHVNTAKLINNFVLDEDLKII